MTDLELREHWINWCGEYCNREFNPLSLPSGVELFVSNKVEQGLKFDNISSESLSDMSQSYFDSDLSKTEKQLLAPYKKLVVL